MSNSAILTLPHISDARGSLTFFENGKDLPFRCERVYWIYDVPGGEIRGGHAFRRSEEIIIALSGSFDVVCTSQDGSQKRYHLNRSYSALYVPRGTWRHLENFSTNSVALVAASTRFDASDYVYSQDDYATLSDEVLSNVSILETSQLARPEDAVGQFNVSCCKLLELPTFYFANGSLTVAESFGPVDFGIERVFYLYDIKSGANRGGHAHKRLFQAIVAASGSFEVVLNDGHESQHYFLNKPNQILIVPPGIWAEINDFSSASVCLVLASMPYDEGDYVRDYTDFLAMVQ
jgi:dTDP-4-dehydrorhamnose 3,5-epimerase-like enzyme